MLLLVGHLIRDVVDWRNANPDSIGRLETHLSELLSASTRATQDQPMVLEAVILASVAVAEAVHNTALSQQIRDIARSAIAGSGPDGVPGEDLARRAATLSLFSGSSDQALLFNALTAAIDEDDLVALLERIAHTERCPVNADAFQTVMRLAADRCSPEAVRIAALDLIGKRRDEATAGNFNDGHLDPSLLFYDLTRSSCVPLKESIVPALASILVDQPAAAMIDSLVQTIAEFSHEDQVCHPVVVRKDRVDRAVATEPFLCIIGPAALHALRFPRLGVDEAASVLQDLYRDTYDPPSIVARR